MLDVLWQTSHVHGIPHHNFAHAERDYEKLFNEMAQFVLPYVQQSEHRVLAIYTKASAQTLLIV